MRRIAVPFVLAALAACDVPTRAPQWDVEWNVPSSSTKISIASLLPGTISITPDSSAFLVTVPSISITEPIGADCPTCTPVVTPKPAFTMSASAGSSLPSELLSATLGQDTIVISASHDLSFDPLRPSAAPGSATGYAVVVLRNGSTIIGRDSVNGATTPFSAGTTITRRVALSGTVSASNPITLDVTIYSPAGDPVAVDPSSSVTLSASAPNFQVASASVAVSTRQVSATSTSFDLTGMSSDVMNRVRNGALELAIDNPIAVSGTLDVSLTTPTTTIVKSISIAAGTPATHVSTSTSVAFTQSELRSLFGQVVGVQVSGPVTAPTGSVTLTPKQVIGVTTRLDVVLNTSTTGGN